MDVGSDSAVVRSERDRLVFGREKIRFFERVGLTASAAEALCVISLFVTVGRASIKVTGFTSWATELTDRIPPPYCMSAKLM